MDKKYIALIVAVVVALAGVFLKVDLKAMVCEVPAVVVAK